MADEKKNEAKSPALPKLTAAELNTINASGLARERGALAMRLAVVEYLEEKGELAMALEVSRLKVKL